MKAFVCEMCGSNNLIKQGGFYVCQSCGTMHTIADSEEPDDYLRLVNLAKSAFSERDFSSAFRYSSEALEIQPDAPDMLSLKGASMFGKEPATDASVKAFPGYFSRSLASLKTNKLPYQEQKSMCNYISGCLRSVASYKIEELNNQEKVLMKQKVPFDPKELEQAQIEYNRAKWISDAATKRKAEQNLNALKMQEMKAKRINPGLQFQIDSIRSIVKKTEETKTKYTKLLNEHLIHIRAAERSEGAMQQDLPVFSKEEISNLESQLGELQRELKPIRASISEKRKQLDSMKASNRSSHTISYERKKEINKRIQDLELQVQINRGVFASKKRQSLEAELLQLKKQLEEDDTARSENMKNRDSYQSELKSLTNELTELLAQEQDIKTRMVNITEKLKRLK